MLNHEAHEGSKSEDHQEDSLRVLRALRGSIRAFYTCRFEQDLLRAPVIDFCDEERVGVAAVDLVYRRELARRLAGLAELADDRAIELHLVDFAGDLRAGRRRAVLPRVRGVEILL